VITLVLGGARSGKSELAERLVAKSGLGVTYVATGQADEGDADMAARIERHRIRRPAEWSTVEAGEDLAAAVVGLPGAVLVDSLGTWLARLEGFKGDFGALAAALTARPGATVVVSDEVGLGVHPSTEVGRQFRDALGELNRVVADAADEVLLVVAGRVLRLEEQTERAERAERAGRPSGLEA
jgi:adenosylcobinamide kinase / adenosylcobinamide-phosphate guanylyltransferase